MENTNTARLDYIFDSQKSFFATGRTLPIDYRKRQLFLLARAIKRWEKPLYEALWTDLHKSYEEAYLTETSIVLAEIEEARRHVTRWSRRERKRPTLSVMPSRNYVVKEPLGTALIIAPWNYPIQLLLSPLVGAIAAGCTVVLKTSPYVPHVSDVIEKMISESFSVDYIAVVQGNRDVNTHLLDKPFDMIFYTGSPNVAHSVMEAAARHLTPVVLELGGKSPCIVDRDADIEIAAKRIAWGKTLNSGQTCIAPDYILIHPEVKERFVEAFARQLKNLHGEDVQQSTHYVRMVSDKAFARVSAYLKEGRILAGGHTDAQERYIEPTLMDQVDPNSPVMQEEIFGPIFPLITLEKNGGPFDSQVVRFVGARPKPLALYYYGSEHRGWEIIGRTTSGGACINDCIMHIANAHMPFGGVGNSGMGCYHGKESFNAFTHRRSVLASPRHFDLPIRYMPYRWFNWVKHLV